VRPALKPGLLPVWRDRDTLQIGIDSRRAVALTGMAGIAWVIGLLDGSRDRAQVIETAVDRGIPAETAERVLALLATAGALDDFPAGTLRVLPPPLRSRLAAELATVSLAHGDGDGGARTLARRLAALICIHGGGRVGAGIAGLLKASGIGRVTHASPGDDGLIPPGAVPPDQEPPGPEQPGPEQPGKNQSGREPPGKEPTGRRQSRKELTGRRQSRRELTGRKQSRRELTGRKQSSQAPPGRKRPGRAPTGQARPDLAILVGRQPMELRAWLMREQIPHLAAAADEAIGIVGPLVIPGRTACLRCMDLTRTDRDPAWPLILAQLAGRAPDPLACDAPLAAAVAAQAAAQGLAFIDRAAVADAVTNGTLELVLPGWQWRRRTWMPHQDCSCSSTTFRRGE
jgi:hypothetical protein